MSAGLSAIGSKKCEAVTVPMGRMATKSVIRQSCGTKLPCAMMIMPAMETHESAMENLNCCSLAESTPPFTKSRHKQGRETRE